MGMKYIILILLIVADVLMLIYYPIDRTSFSIQTLSLALIYGAINAFILLMGKDVIIEIRRKYGTNNKKDNNS